MNSTVIQVCALASSARTATNGGPSVPKQTFAQRRRLIHLAREIRTDYIRTCALATRWNECLTNETKPLRDACRARPQTLVPELDHFETIFDRQDAMRRALADPAVRRAATLLASAGYVVMMIAFFHAVHSGGGLLLPVLLAMATAAGMFCLHQQLILRGKPFRRKLRKQLLDRGVPICLECGYDLRGQVEPRCPECGSQTAYVVDMAGIAGRYGGITHAR